MLENCNNNKILIGMWQMISSKESSSINQTEDYHSEMTDESGGDESPLINETIPGKSFYLSYIAC